MRPKKRTHRNVTRTLLADLYHFHLRFRRELARMSMPSTDVAEVCGVDVATVTAWFDGKKLPSLSEIFLLKRNSDVDLGYLFTGKRKPPDDSAYILHLIALNGGGHE